MKDTINKIVYPSKTLMCLISFFYRIKNKRKYEKAIKKRLASDLLENYNIHTQELPYYPYDYIPDNNMYGLGFTLKKYLNIPVLKSLNIHFEHGLYLGGYIAKISKISYAKKIVTLGENRKEHLLKDQNGKEIICIGSYILYADSLIKKEACDKLKQKLGKTLLVFPSHSIKGLQANYDESLLINQIKSQKSNYDTVLICMYYLDIRNKKLVKSYQDVGAKIVCAGHKFDCYFLPRLKTIIELSDYTISNAVGTHIGYCLSLGKKHQIFDQKIEYEGGNEREKNIRNKLELDLLNVDKQKITSSLNNENEKETLDYYWGMSSFTKKDVLLKKITN